MSHLRLIHWNETEARNCLEILAGLNWAVQFEIMNSPDALKRLKEDRPLAFLIDLSRLPSQGRDIALLL